MNGKPDVPAPGSGPPGERCSLTVLGCDGSWPGPGGAGSGYLVVAGETRVLVDIGPGVFSRLQEHVDPALIDAVVVTHHHADHWTDLHMLGAHARFALGRTGLPVMAPEGLRERAHLTGSPAFSWRSVTDGDQVRVGGLDLTFRRTDHAFETLAVRVEGQGWTLGYSADTGPGWSLEQLGAGLDLVVCEATYTTDHEGTAGHLSGRQAGMQARQAAARRLVVTHRWPTIDAVAVAAEAEVAFGGPVEQAVIGKEFIL